MTLLIGTSAIPVVFTFSGCQYQIVQFLKYVSITFAVDETETDLSAATKHMNEINTNLLTSMLGNNDVVPSKRRIFWEKIFIILNK